MAEAHFSGVAEFVSHSPVTRRESGHRADSSRLQNGGRNSTDCTGLGKRVVPRLHDSRVLASSGRGVVFHAT